MAIHRTSKQIPPLHKKLLGRRYMKEPKHFGISFRLLAEFTTATAGSYLPGQCEPIVDVCCRVSLPKLHRNY